MHKYPVERHLGEISKGVRELGKKIGKDVAEVSGRLQDSQVWRSGERLRLEGDVCVTTITVEGGLGR